eukprot:6649309-Pyramimonas_sp.AAC.1
MFKESTQITRCRIADFQRTHTAPDDMVKHGLGIDDMVKHGLGIDHMVKHGLGIGESTNLLKA